MSLVRLRVDGPADVEVALWQWLRSQPDLRGQVSRHQLSADVGAMGGGTEIVLALLSTGTLAAAAHAVGVWLTQQRADISVTVTLPDGRTMTLDAQRIRPEDAVRLLQSTGGDVIPAPEAPPTVDEP